jgi:4-hydroxy-tetrahydrodipicolinate synthase
VDHNEHEQIIATVIEQSRGRIKAMPGTGSNSTREAIRLTKFAKSAGADARHGLGRTITSQARKAIIVTSRRWRKPDLPVVLYNIPGRTGSNITPETIARLAEIPSIVAIKEATGSLDQASHIASLCNLTILSGDDSLTLPLMSIGGRGWCRLWVISCRDLKALVSAFDAGKVSEAIAWHKKLFHLSRDLLSVSTNPIPLKTAMKLLGRDTGELRLPLWPLDTMGETKVAATLQAYGLMK